MTVFDFVIIGAGPAGEAAAFEARRRGASVGVVDRRWFGGSCPHVGCVPSKTLLYAASRHVGGAGYDWERASARRDWMINRPPGAAEPDDTGHVRALEEAGAVAYRGSARIVGRGRVLVEGADGGQTGLDGREIVVATGSRSRVPPIPGLDRAHVWTNVEATLARERPASMVVLGGGPTGCELAQVYARFDVPVAIVQAGERLAPTDHPRNSAAIRFALERDGVDVRTGVRAVRVRAGAGPSGADVIELDDGATVAGAVILVAVGRDLDLDELGLEHYGLDASERVALPRDGRLRMADGLWFVGDPAGPELHTHQAHYQGEIAVRMALGDDVRPDYRALPRATYTEPEAASVGLTLEQARTAGVDAIEFVADFTTTSKGYSVEAETGHLSIVVDRASRELVGVAIAAPDASAAIHEAVLAIRARVPMDVLADTIHAFPSTSRAFNALFAEADQAMA